MNGVDFQNAEALIEFLFWGTRNNKRDGSGYHLSGGNVVKALQHFGPRDILTVRPRTVRGEAWNTSQ